MQPCSKSRRKHTILRSFHAVASEKVWQGLSRPSSSARGLAEWALRLSGIRGPKAGPDFSASVTGHMRMVCVTRSCISQGLDACRLYGAHLRGNLPLSSNIAQCDVLFQCKGRREEDVNVYGFHRNKDTKIWKGLIVQSQGTLE